MLLPRENTLFVPGPTPVLVLGDAPVHGALPALHAPEGRIPVVDGWMLAAMPTMCVVDGPGEAGCLIPAVHSADPAADLAEMAEWLDSVDRAGGALVISVDRLPTTLDWDTLLTGGDSRGGFITTGAPA